MESNKTLNWNGNENLCFIDGMEPLAAFINHFNFSSIKQKKTSQWNSAMEVNASLEWMNEWAACFVLLVGYERGTAPLAAGELHSIVSLIQQFHYISLASIYLISHASPAKLS